ncbi:proteasome subunit alpha type [Gregarina niphandrodes]|uniref:Proteasome subunit alpha type n=1 Tax=Gregarina niphandrodes TaxID=110365 RepID=A0A023AZ37_GRENI|nr:proteasome subunit alpha type [Gregarina niphandrodes]EZG43763.1 proteasome subunit alpha type [Gregarina niphandrodes]|eukprot:XP_011134634.1 proteasome subunit alpha type [Gregarina niphandrodes]
MASGYDLSVSTFSPDGKVFQVEYACKAVGNGALSVAGIFKDGVVLGSENWVLSPLAAPRTRLFKLAAHACAIVTGSLPDGKNLIDHCREECAQYQRVWGVPIPGSILADRVGVYVHGFTAVWSTRPVGASLMIAVHEQRQRQPFVGAGAAVMATTDKAVDQHGILAKEPEQADWCLWLIDPTGAAYKYRGNCQGKGAAGAKTDLENIDMPNMTVRQGVQEFAKLLHKHHEDVRLPIPSSPLAVHEYMLYGLCVNSREKSMVLEMMVLQDGKPARVETSQLAEAEAAAKAWLAEEAA